MKRNAEQLFSEVKDHFSSDRSVALGKMFGTEGLKSDGKVFAMHVKGDLVVKLPVQRVDELMVLGVGTRFDPGHGRLMKEWIQIPPGKADWTGLAVEARSFVDAVAGK